MCVFVCLWTSNPYLYCEGRTNFKIIFKFILILYWTLAIVWCVFHTMYVTFRKFSLFPAKGDWPTDKF